MGLLIAFFDIDKNYKKMIDELYFVANEKNYPIYLLNNNTFKELKNNILRPRIKNFIDNGYMFKIPDPPIIILVDDNLELDKFNHFLSYQYRTNLIIVCQLDSFDKYSKTIFSTNLEYIVYLSESSESKDQIFILDNDNNMVGSNLSKIII